MEKIRLIRGRASADITPLGAEMVSYSPDGSRQMLWSGREDIWPGHSPVLFPVVDFLKDHTVLCGDFACHMEPHGFARFSVFSVAWQEEDSVELELTANADTKKCYPFDFRFSVRYVLEADGFRAIFRATNLSDRIMPFCMGGHPAFVCPMNPGESFDDYEVVYEKEEDPDVALIPDETVVEGVIRLEELKSGRILPLSHKLFAKYGTVEPFRTASRQVELLHRDTRKGIRVTFDFPVLSLWTKPVPQAEFICLEPWQGFPAFANETGQFTDKLHVLTLQPGASAERFYKVALID